MPGSLILGEPHPQVPLDEGIRDLGLENRVRLMGHQTLQDFDGYLAACNVILNLRQTTFGESSGTMMRAFGLGKPVIVSAIGASLELPDDVCIKIPRDRHETRVTTERVKWLLSNQEAAAEIGARAKQWVAEECTWDNVAQRYLKFLREKSGNRKHPGGERRGPEVSGNGSPALSDAAISSYLSRWIDPASPAGVYFAAHSIRLIRTIKLIPRGDSGGRILELGCYMQISLRSEVCSAMGRSGADIWEAREGGICRPSRLWTARSSLAPSICLTVNRIGFRIRTIHSIR